LLAKKHTVTCLVPWHPGAKLEEEMDGVTVVRFKYFFGFERLCYDGGILANMKKSFLAKLQPPFLVKAQEKAIRNIVKKEKIDLIHAHWIVPQGYIASKIKRRFGTPYVVTAHAGDIFPLKNPFFRKIGKRALQDCSACTVNSKATGKAVQDLYPVDMSIIPMGVDLKQFSPKLKDKKVRKEFGIDGEFLLFVGRIAEKKGLTYLLDAMPSVVEQFPKVKLVIIGDGPLKIELEAQAENLKLGENVVFAGKRKNEDLGKYFASADVFVGPSIVTKNGDTEGLGVVFLEALASGTVVIGGNVGGVPDIIKDGKTGLLVEEKNSKELSKKIIELLEDKKKREKMVKAGQKHIKDHYDWEKVSRKFEELFSKVV
jgi:glycosyltransferase involved in cell wall biosynthesis